MAFLQLARLAGIEAYGTVSAGKAPLVADLGAVPIDYRSGDVVATLRGMTDGVDAVFDPIGGTHYLRSARVLRRGGTLVAFGASRAARHGRGSKLVAVASMLLFGLLKVIAEGRRVVFYIGDSLRKHQPESYHEDLAAVLGLLADRTISPIIAERLPLSEATRAYRLLEAASVRGKIILAPDQA